MRVKTGTTRHRRHKEIKEMAKGFRGHRRRTIKGAKEGILNALSHAYIGRKHKKRVMRSLWIIRMNAALREMGLSYSKFIAILKKQNVALNRKVLSEVAYHDPETFKLVVTQISSKSEG